MTGMDLPAWDPQTAVLIGSILLEAVVLYAGYGGIERLVGPTLLTALVGGEAGAGE